MTYRTQLIEPNGDPLMITELPIAPFAGDIVRVGDVSLRVVRRAIVALPTDTPPWDDPGRIDMELTVREA